MKKVLVKPVSGLKIRDPEKGDFLPAEGRKVTMNIFWRRRLKDNSITMDELKLATKNVQQRGRKGK